MINLKFFNYINEIQGCAFEECSSLNEVHFIENSSISVIKENTFAAGSSLVKINIPDSVKLIGSNAFVGCKSLKEILIPSSFQKIGGSAFFHCSSLQKVSFEFHCH